MKKTLMIALTAFACATFADDSAERILSELESATGWTRTELIEGLKRLDRLYQNEMKTEDGRRRWHGSVRLQIVSTNTFTKLEIHDDGYTNVTPFKAVSPTTPKRPKRTAMTNGVPEALQAARIRRAAEVNAGTVVTNVVRTVNGN